MSIRYHIWSIVKILGCKLKSICGCLRDNPIMAASTVQDTIDHKVEKRNSSLASAEKADKIAKKWCKTAKSVKFQINEPDAVPKATNNYEKLPYITVQLKVAMHCEGCKQKVIRALSKMDEVKQINISMQKQKVEVSGYIDPQMVVETIQKTGKQVEIWSDNGADQSGDVQSNAWKSIEALPDPSDSSVADELKDKHATEKVMCMQEKSQLANDDPASLCKQAYQHQKQAAAESSSLLDSHSGLPSPLSCNLPKDQEPVKSSEHEVEKLEKKPSKEDMPSQTAANLSNPVVDQLLHREEEAPLQPNEGQMQEKKKGKHIPSEEDDIENLSPASSDLHSLHPDQHRQGGGSSDSYGNNLTSRLISSADELLQELLTGRLMKAREVVRSFAKTKQEDGSNPTTHATNNPRLVFSSSKMQSEGSNCSSRNYNSNVSQLGGRSDAQETRIHKVLPSVTDVLVLLPPCNNRSGRHLHERQNPDRKSCQRAKPSDSSIPGHVQRKDASCQTISKQDKAPPSAQNQ